MGTMNHNAIIATTFSDEIAAEFLQWCKQTLAEQCFVATPPVINGYQSFFFPPDGSKEGWEGSDSGDAVRQLVIDRLEKDKYEDDSSPWDWVEVGFGEYGQKVLRGNNTNRYNDAEYAVATAPDSTSRRQA